MVYSILSRTAQILISYLTSVFVAVLFVVLISGIFSVRGVFSDGLLEKFPILIVFWWFGLSILAPYVVVGTIIALLFRVESVWVFLVGGFFCLPVSIGILGVSESWNFPTVKSYLDPFTLIIGVSGAIAGLVYWYIGFRRPWDVKDI